MKTQFKSKEHYLAFLQAWATAVNSEKGKTHYVEKSWTHGSTTEIYNEKVDGWITSAHHVMYNLLRNRTFHRGFTVVSNRNKLLNGADPMFGLYLATKRLRRVQGMIQQERNHPEYVTTSKMFGLKKEQKPTKPYWGTSHIDAFLEPFGGTIDRDMIMKLDVPEVKQMWTSYGQAARVVVAILDGSYSPKNYDDLMTIFEEVV